MKRANRGSQDGLVIVYFSFFMFLVLGIAALIMDAGRAYMEKHRLQSQLDIISLAAAWKLPGNDATIWQTVQDFAALNGVGFSTELNLTDSIQCGNYNGFSFTIPDVKGNTDICSVSNAVRLHGRRGVFAAFAKIFGIKSLLPNAVVIAVKPSAGGCIKPFGVTAAPLENLVKGDEFEVGGSTGNWGKVDVPNADGTLNMSSGQLFETAMLQQFCSDQIALGAQLTPGTGFGGPIKDVMEDLQDAGQGRDLLIPVVTPFPNGNNGTVTILEFVKVDLISQSGNGSNWRGRFRVVERNSDPWHFSSPTNPRLVL